MSMDDKAFLMQVAHDQAHEAPHDLEDMLFVTISWQDLWTLTFAVLCVGEFAPCLSDQAGGLLERIVELLDVQKPHWRERADEA